VASVFSQSGLSVHCQLRVTFSTLPTKNYKRTFKFVRIINRNTFSVFFISDTTSNLSKAHETRGSFSSSCSQIVLVYLQPFRRSSLLKSAPQPKIAKKPLKLSISEGSRSFKVTDVNTTKTFVTNASHDKQHIYAYLQLFSR